MLSDQIYKSRNGTIFVYLIVLVTTISSSNLNWGKDHWRDIIEADAKGYYAYLPAIFIYHDLNLGFYDYIEKEKYYDKNLVFDYRMGVHGHSITKYFAGTALAEMPFFLIAHFYCSYLSDTDADGYSKPYHVLVSISGLFYLLIGLLYLNKLLTLYSIRPIYRLLVFITAMFGTNMFIYIVIEPGVSHIYSFAFISMFLYYGRSYFNESSGKFLLIIMALLGLICLIRPVNFIIVLSLPFLAGNYDNLKSGVLNIRKYGLWFAAGLVIFAAIGSIQLILYKISTDHFFIYAYGDEGFDFLNPHFIDILFSYRKGLFLYTPMYLLCFTGCYFLWKRSRFECLTWLGFFIILTYVVSSWKAWYYGGGFSSRVYVEYLSLFLLLFGLTLERALSLWKTIYISTSVVLVAVCIIQTYQYRYNIIHWSDMTKEKYWDVFLRVDELIERGS